MKLSKQDADLFYTLMWPLQFFVNQRLRILPDIDTLQAYIACSSDLKFQVRNALYENIDLVDVFITENPNSLSEDMLAVVTTWKHFIDGDFYIERLLKKYAVFIASDDNVYAVLGLNDAFQDMFHPSQLPILVKVVLLPFKDHTVYDGLLQGYNIFFGRGISLDLKETYMAAKQNGRIIERLGPASHVPKTKKQQKPAKDWRPELDDLAVKAKSLRASADQPPVFGPTFSLVKASVELAQSAIADPDDLDRLWKTLKKVNRAMSKVETTLYRSERYQ